MKKILYPTHIEDGNLGDILINGLLVKELSISHQIYLKGTPPKEMQKIMYQNNPFKSNIHTINIDSKNLLCRKFAVLFLLLKKKKFDYVFDTPGHITRKTSTLKTLLKALNDLFKIIVYQIFGVKSIKFGITLGPFKYIEWTVYKYICKASFLISVRDKENYNQLKNKRLYHIELTPDIAFLAADTQNITNNLKVLNSITITLRGSVSGKHEDQTYLTHILEKTRELIQLLQINHKKIDTINLVYQVDCDRNIIPKLQQFLSTNFKHLNVTIFNEQLTLNSAKNIYASSQFVITNRLHVFLIAMMVGTKTYIVTDNRNHRKLITILSDLNLNSLIFEHDKSIDVDCLDELEAFNAIAKKNKQEIVKRISLL